MLSIADIAREYFPEASDSELEGIVWERTGFPCFFEGEPESCLREQLAAFRAMVDSYPGGNFCWNCNALTVPNKDLCVVCESGLDTILKLNS